MVFLALHLLQQETGRKKLRYANSGVGYYNDNTLQNVVTDKQFNFYSDWWYEYPDDTHSLRWTVKSKVKIIKQDKDDNNVKLDNVEIQFRRGSSTTIGTGTTSNGGQIMFEDLEPNNSYTVWERATNNYGYIGTAAWSNKVSISSLIPGTINIINVDNEKQTGNLKIVKTDYDSGDSISGIGFKLKNSSGYVVATTSGGTTGTVFLTNMSTTSSASSATEFFTDSSGQIEIYNLLKGNYTVIETSENYKEYELDPDYIRWNGTKGLSTSIYLPRQASYNTIKSCSDSYKTILNVTNEKKWIDISGRVWEELANGKDNTFNNTYDNRDIKLKRVNVMLMYDGTTEETKETDDNGQYKFEHKLLRDVKANKYRLEFEYDGQIYTTVKLGSVTDALASKAQEDSNARSRVDDSYQKVSSKGEVSNSQSQSSVSGDSGTFTVNYDTQIQDNTDASSISINAQNVKDKPNSRNVNYFSNFENYTINRATANTANDYLSSAYWENRRQTELGGTNCGLVQREQVNLSLATDLEEVVVSVNGYTNTYKYGAGATKSNDEFRLDVKANDQWGYYREMYASDIIFEGREKCEVYMTYSIKIQNNSNTLNAKVSRIVNYRNPNYDVKKIGTVNEANGEIIANIECKDARESNGYTKSYLTYKEDESPTLTPGNKTTIYVKYELKNKEVVNILSGNPSLESISEIDEYTTYYGASTWYSTGTRTGVYASIDKNSAPGNCIPGNKMTYEDDTMAAPTLKMKLTEAERTIAGNVFEDKTADTLQIDQERLGDGVYQDEDRNVENVTVELYKWTDSSAGGIWDQSNIGDLASVWTKETPEGYAGETEDITGRGKKTQAKVKTDKNGHYSLTGIVPGVYILKYTYGNGSVIYSKEGTIVKELDNADEYKSTIIASDDIKNALERHPASPLWFKTTENEGRYSDAVDDKTAYEDCNEKAITVNSSSQFTGKIEYKSAYTAPMNIKLELVTEGGNIYTGEANTESSKVIVTNPDGTQQVENIISYQTNNVDFGIVQRSKQTYEIKKEIKDVKLALSNANTIINGNPQIDRMSGVKYLKDEAKKQDTLNMEVDNEILQGNELNITYNVTATYKAEINYLTEGYFYYGTDKINEKQEYMVMSKVIDYIDDEIQFVGEKEGSNPIRVAVVDDEKIKFNDNSELNSKDYLKDDVITQAKNYNTVLILESNNKLKRNESCIWTYNTSKLIGLSDSLDYENFVETIEVQTLNTVIENNILGNQVPFGEGLINNKETDFYSVIAAITSPTGENRSYFSYIIIATSLICITIGIIIIKRKVL